MLCRAVLTALAISYLICVLWLSGLQKEDLDVNMLRKLQRHNVNIDDNNRDNLRKDCLNTFAKDDNANDGNNLTTDDDDPKASTLLLESETGNNRKSEESEVNNKYMMKDEKQKNADKDATVIREKIEVLPRENDNESDYLTENTDTSVKSLEKRVDGNGQTNLDSILNFWKMFSVQKRKESIISVSKATGNNKGVPRKKNTKKSHKADLLDQDPEKRSSKEMEQINKLLADYFYKNKKSSTTQSTVISSPDMNHLNKLTQQFENFFKLVAKSKIIMTNTQEDKKIVQDNSSDNRYTTTANNYFLDNNIPQQRFLMQATNKKLIERNANKHSVSDISHLLFYNDQLKKSFPQINETFLLPYLVPVNYQPNYNQQLYGIPVATTNQPTISENKIVTPQDMYNADKTIPKGLIGMIAENVKAIVLKDLHNEITSTLMTTLAPLSSTPTATETSSTITSTITTISPVAVTTPPENKTVEVNQVLRSIMDLFKEFKALKDKTESTSTVTPKPTAKYEVIKGDFNNPLLIQNNLLMQMMNQKYSNMRTAKETATVSYEPQNTKDLRAHNNPTQMERISTNEKMQFPVQIIQDTEIIQTNSGEIPPLGIRLSKPSQLIHQNIVVTTVATPARKYSQEWASDYHEKPNSQRDQSRNIRNKLDRYRYSTHFQYSSTPSQREMIRARHRADTEPILSRYRPYISHRESNYSKYNSNSFNRESNRAPYRFDSRMQHSSNPFDRDHLKQYDSKQLKLDSNPSKFDLLPSLYTTRLPQFRMLSDNERYDVRDRGQNYEENKKLAESRFIERSRAGYRLGYTPRYEVSRLSKVEKDFIDRNDREQLERNKGISKNVKKTDRERFHERLEKVDAWREEKKGELKEVEKDCNDLASRQQLALNTMKMRYDESHFKNFLKTQQKVNDMLEKILASKNSEQRSVEVI